MPEQAIRLKISFTFPSRQISKPHLCTLMDVGAGCILEKMDGKGSNGYNNCCYCREHTAMCFLISSDVKTWGENQYEE